MRFLSTAALTLWLAASSSAQTIDVEEYMPLGVFNSWRYAEVGNPKAKTSVKTKRVDLVDSTLHYQVAAPFLDSMKKVQADFAQIDGELVLTRLFFQDPEALDFSIHIEQLTLKPIVFDPPIVLGDDATSVGGADFVTAVDATFDGKAKFGPFRETIEFRATGSVTSSWLDSDEFPDGGDTLDFLVGDGSDRVTWRLTIDLDLEALEDGSLFDASYTNTVHVLLGEDIGPMVVTDVEGDLHELQSVITPSETLGAGFETAPALEDGPNSVDFDAPGLFFYQDGVGASGPYTDANVLFDDLQLYHQLSGNARLVGTARLAGGGDAQPFELLGKIQCNALKQTAKLNMKGKLPGLFEKPLQLRAKATMLPGASTFVLSYKAGKDVVGAFNVPINSRAANSVSLSIEPLYDRDFKVRKNRRLGAEGTLTVGGIDYAVTFTENRLTPLGKNQKHAYAFFQTGFKPRLMNTRALTLVDEFGELDVYLLTDFNAKLFGASKIAYKALDVNSFVDFEF